MIQARQWRLLRWQVAACGVLGILWSGCTTMPPSLVACPLPATEQAARIQQLVPLGTPREEAIATLLKSGIDGTFSTGNSIFYCDTWTQSEDERWHLDVQLMFDEAGNVYAYRTDAEAVAGDQVGAAQVAKKPKEVAVGPKPSVADPFAE